MSAVARQPVSTVIEADLCSFQLHMSGVLCSRGTVPSVEVKLVRTSAAKPAEFEGECRTLTSQSPSTLTSCLQSSCTPVHLQPTMILMIDGCGSRPTLKTSHVTFDRRETGKIYTSFPSAREALVSHLVWILLVFAHVVNSGMSLTMELVVTQLQQEIITLNAQVADRTGPVEAIHASNNLATAHVRKGTSSLVDVKGLGRPPAKTKILSSVRRRRGAFFAGVIKKSEMMQEWSAEQVTKITQELINLEFLPTVTNVDRGELNQEFVLQQMDTALMALTSYEANDTVTNSRKNPLEAWRRLQQRYDPTSGGRKRHLLRAIISLGRCSLSELQAGIDRWESYLSRLEKKLKDTLDDEIKLAGLEALVPEELEKHLILNSSRLRTFDDARFKLVTFVDAMFGLRIRDSKPNETRARGHCGPMDVDAINSIASATGKGKGSSNPRDGCFKNGGAHVQSDCNARHTSQRQWR